MIIVFSIFMVLSLSPALIIGFVRKRYYFPFVLVLLYYCTQPPLMLNYFSQFTDQDIYASCLYLLVSNIAFSAILLAGESRISFKDPHRAQLDIGQATVAIFIAALTMLVFYAISQSGINIEENTWTQREENYFSLFGPILSYSGFLIFALWTNIKSIPIRVLLIPILVLVFLSTGARVIFMVIFGAFWLWAIRRLTRRQIVVYGSIAGVGFVAIHVIGRVLRSVGMGALLNGDLAAVGDAIAESEDLTGGDGSIGEGFVLAMQGFRDHAIVSVPFATLIRLAMLPLPSTIVPFKPDDITFRLWRYGIESGYFDQDLYFHSLIESYSLGQNGSLHPIIWGDALLNAGWLGCILWPVLLVGLLLGVEKIIINNQNSFLGRMSAAVAAPGLIYVIRGNVFIGLVIMLIPMLFSYGVLQAKRILAPRQLLAAA